MAVNDRKKHFLWSVVVVFIIQLPLLLYTTTSLANFIGQLLLFLAVAVGVGAVYVGLVRALNADRQAPIPWYASPVVWLGVPVLIFILYVIWW